MLTPYRQKYNPKKPRSKIKRLETTVQVFFEKNFFYRGLSREKGGATSKTPNQGKKKSLPIHLWRRTSSKHASF